MIEDSDLATAAADELMPCGSVYEQVFEGCVDLVRGDVGGGQEIVKRIRM